MKKTAFAFPMFCVALLVFSLGTRTANSQDICGEYYRFDDCDSVYCDDMCRADYAYTYYSSECSAPDQCLCRFYCDS